MADDTKVNTTAPFVHEFRRISKVRQAGSQSEIAACRACGAQPALPHKILCPCATMTSTTARVTYGTVQLSDGPAIAYALHTPPSAPNQNVRLALVAHPLGRLGGSKEDHVVTALAGLLSNDLGYIVCRYDARGSGGSTGSASWT